MAAQAAQLAVKALPRLRSCDLQHPKAASTLDTLVCELAACLAAVQVPCAASRQGSSAYFSCEPGIPLRPFSAAHRILRSNLALVWQQIRVNLAE